METTGDKEQVQIRFITRQKQFAVPDYPLSVPSESPVSELNVLVNELLKESDEQRKTIEFDFLVNSEFLRSSLKEHISEKDISVENVIDVEYIEKHPPPEPQDCLIHDDWVSAVAMQDKWILSGCYDNTLHIWTAKGAHHLNIPVYHTAAIKSVAWISMDNESATFVSASQDQTAIIWKWDIANNSVEIVCVCKGHERGLERVGVNARNNLMATGAWDTMLKIWSSSLKNEQENGEPPSKRSKADPSKTRMPIRTIKAHREAVSGVVWSDKAELITASWDHSIKIWDAELGGMKHEIPGNKSFFDIDYSPLNRMIIAGSADRHVRLFDPRSTDTVVKTQFTSHNSWVSAVSWSTTDEHLFLSGAYDNEVKLWDTRSPKAPLFDLSGHEDKVLCCNWSNPKYLISGGSDNTVRIFKSKHAVH